MNSDDEDFNDIYGDDESVTKNNTQESSTEDPTAKEQPGSSVNEVSNAAAAVSDLQHDKQEAGGETGQQRGSDVPAEAEQSSATNSNPVSQLDQLAALQALSSNLNQLQADKSNPTGGNESQNSGQGNPGSVSTNPTWEQLQQTMSQFQQQGQQQQQQQQQSQSQQDHQAVSSTEGTPDNAQVAPRPHIKADISKDNCKMFIGGLNWETTEDGLREYFSKYGRVVDLRIMKDNNTGRSRGFGFLTFESPSSVDEVVKTQHILDGKVIDPKRSIPREEKDKTGKIFVGGIGADVRPKEFEEFFAKYGTIIDAQLMLDKDTGRSRGFGFVTYDSPDAVDRVCQNKYIEFKGKQIEIKRAEPRHMQKGHGSGGGHGNNYNNYNNNNRNNNNNNNNSNSNSNFGSASPMAMQNPYGAAMYQNPMMNMGGFNPMFNPQAMQEYYQKMQEYYQQMQQQTGMDPAQMYQQQMQQMAMMMSGGYAMPGMMQSPSPGMMQAGMQTHDNSIENSRSGGGGASGRNNSNNNNGSDNGNDDDDEDSKRVQTIGGESADDRPSGDHSGNSGKSSSSNSIDINLPRGPRDPNTIPPPSGHGGGYSGQRDRERDRGHQGGYRGGNSGGSGGNSYRGGGYRTRGGFRRSNNNSGGGGYHPYKR